MCFHVSIIVQYVSSTTGGSVFILMTQVYNISPIDIALTQRVSILFFFKLFYNFFGYGFIVLISFQLDFFIPTASFLFFPFYLFYLV